MSEQHETFDVGVRCLHRKHTFDFPVPAALAMRTSVILLAVLGTVQALFLAGVLCARPNNRQANRALAALLVAMAVYLGVGAYQLAGLVSEWPLPFAWSHPMPLLFGPLLYLYALLATNSERRLGVRDAWHAVPALAVVAWALPIYLLPGVAKIALFEAMRLGDVPDTVRRQLDVVGWLKLVSGVVYTTLTVRVTVRHRREIRTRYSTLEGVTLDWLLLLVLASVIAWGIALFARLLEPWEIVHPGTGDAVIAAMMVAATYALGFRGLQQVATAPPGIVPPHVPLPTDASDFAAADSAQPDSTEADSVASSTPAAADRALLTPGMVNAIEQRLRMVMERDEAWRHTDLTLADLAERVGTTSHKLSAVLNNRVEQNFYDFVNGYRVREVQRQLRHPDSASRTVLTMAMDAGFASKSTFNAVFRRQVGMTPSAWREAQRPMAADYDPDEVRMDPDARPAR